MRNLIAFLYKYYGVIIFLLLQVFCLTALFNFNAFHKLVYHNTLFQLTGRFYSLQTGVSEYVALKDQNEKLNEENAKLKQQVRSSYISVPNTFQLVNDTLLRQQYEFIPAKIINSSTSKQHNYFTLNVGRNSGITEGMGVVSEDGIVGTITRVNDYYSLVLPLVNLRFTASVEVEETGHFGLLKWEGASPYEAQLEDIAKHAQVQVGHHIITRGSSGIYPEGIPIGTVKFVEPEPGGNYLNIDLQLLTDYTRLKHVFVVRNLLKEVQQELEEQEETE